MSARHIAVIALLLSALSASPAAASETCGDGLDNDANGRVDEGCWPAAVTRVCENPLSCSLTGSISPKLGAVVYSLPTDLAPEVSYGPSIAFRRTYMSHYQPGATAPAYRRPLGKMWHHNWLSWLDKNTAPSPDQALVHLPTGREILFTYASTASGYDVYAPQAGEHGIDYLRQATTSPYNWELRTLEGVVYAYDWSSPTGKLVEVRDTLSTPNVVSVSYDGSGRVQYVTDAAGSRRLKFEYAIDNTLSTVSFQTVASSVPTTRAYWDFTYSSGLLSSARSQGNTAQQYSYSGGHLSLIEDDSGRDVVSFAHLDGTAPTANARVVTSYGELGFDYVSSRSSCTGGTVVYFNRQGTTVCDDDTDCGGGLLCGGETNPASTNTGVCYRAARCLQMSSSIEDLVTTVAPIGPPAETCEGACTDVAEYSWNTGSALDLVGVRDPDDHWTSYSYNSDGLPESIVYGDDDDDASNGGGSRALELFYENSRFRGLVTESRRQSDLSTSTCSRTDATGCQRTIYSYDSNGLMESVEEVGFTLDDAGDVVPYSYVTTQEHDSLGRLTQVDGPLSGDDDVAEYTYWSSSDVTKDGQLREVRRKKDSSSYLITTLQEYDHWGNATSIQEPDGTLTCLTFDAYRNYLAESREAMDGQSSCSTPDSSDLVTSHVRDSWLRLTSTERPGGGCVLYEFDSRARLVNILRRDDCNSSSSGDIQEFTYDDDGLLVKTEFLNAASTVTYRQEQEYFDSRRLYRLINSVAPSTHATFAYNDRGLIEVVEAPSGLSKLAKIYDGEGRVAALRRYIETSTYDEWGIVRGWLGGLETVSDDDGKQITDRRDDMGRRVETTTPDNGSTVRVYRADGKLVAVHEAFHGTGAQDHSYSFDNLGRQLTLDQHGECGIGAPAETEISYDTLPSGVSCPSGVNCSRTEGRVSYVRTTLLCSSSYSDNALDQETFYAYDDAGRLIREYIRDDSSRVADHQYEWTKDGALAQVTTPTGAKVGWTYGTSGHNSDQDLVTKVWRTSDSLPVIDNIAWFPFGPLAAYRHQNQISSTNIQTVMSRNLAYRPTNVRVESTSGTLVFQAAIGEDDKGRVISRDFSGGAAGLQDSYFLYDQLDRVVCENPTSVSTCPSSGMKFSHSGAPSFTASNDWKQFKRPIPGWSTIGHDVILVSGTDQLEAVEQPCTGCSALGTTEYSFDGRGNRVADDNTSTLTNDGRTYTYDGRNNVRTVAGYYHDGTSWSQYVITNAFDSKDRRVFKAFVNLRTSQESHWFFYYDPLDRLTEVHWTPNISSASTYSVFQVSWLDGRPLHMWRTSYPSTTAQRYYLHTDESTRPLEAYDWPSSGNATRIWAANPDAWGNDNCITGCTVYQPFVHAGQYRDPETVAWQNDGVTMHRPALALNGLRTYDPFVGSYLQVDSDVERTWDVYVYAANNPVGNRDPRGDMVRICRWVFDYEAIGDGQYVYEEHEECEEYGSGGGGGWHGGGGGQNSGNDGGHHYVVPPARPAAPPAPAPPSGPPKPPPAPPQMTCDTMAFLLDHFCAPGLFEAACRRPIDYWSAYRDPYEHGRDQWLRGALNRRVYGNLQCVLLPQGCEMTLADGSVPPLPCAEVLQACKKLRADWEKWCEDIEEP